MRIAAVPRRFVSHDWGGTETVVLETSRALRRMGHDVEIFCPAIFSEAPREEIGEVPVRRFDYLYPFLGLSEVDRLQMDKKGGNLFSFSLLRALWRESDLDLIHLHTLKRLGGIGRWVARRRNLPYVVTLHGGVSDVPVEERRDLLAPIRGHLEWGKGLGWLVGSRRVLDDADAILCVGRAEWEAQRKQFPAKRVELMPNGVDPERWTGGDGARFRREWGIPEDAELLLVVGRIDPQKNQKGLVEILPRLLGRHPKLHLCCVGHVTDESYHQELLAMVERHGLDGHVTVIPGLPPHGTGLVDAYAGADAFVLPSRHEPFGVVILEAWCAGLAVAASEVGGIPSFVEDGEDGLLFDPGRPDTMEDAVDRLLGDGELRRRLARRGEAKARERFDWRQVTGRLATLYGELVEEKRRRSAA